MSKTKEVQLLAQSIKKDTDSLDVLINNVGTMIMKRFEDMTLTDIEHLIDLNLKSHLLLTRELLDLLLKSKNPTIVLMSSMAAHSSIIGESVYSATKGAITNFAKILRNEFEGKIRVCVVHAWGVNTFGANDEEAKQQILNPEKIAEAVEFIITRSPEFVVESIELGAIEQWHGGLAPSSPAKQ